MIAWKTEYGKKLNSWLVLYEYINSLRSISGLGWADNKVFQTVVKKSRGISGVCEMKNGINWAASFILAVWILFMLLTGCDAPVTVAERSNQLLHDYNALMVENDALKTQIGILEKAKEEITINQDECNKLINDYHALQTQYVILEAYSQTIRDQYNALLPQIGVRNADKEKATKELAQQYAIVKNRHRLIMSQLDAVHKENVPILSDNLTDIEYRAFYKGWNLWWGEFNE